MKSQVLMPSLTNIYAITLGSRQAIAQANASAHPVSTTPAKVCSVSADGFVDCK